MTSGRRASPKIVLIILLAGLALGLLPRRLFRDRLLGPQRGIRARFLVGRSLPRELEIGRLALVRGRAGDFVPRALPLEPLGLVVDLTDLQRLLEPVYDRILALGDVDAADERVAMEADLCESAEIGGRSLTVPTSMSPCSLSIA